MVWKGGEGAPLVPYADFGGPAASPAAGTNATDRCFCARNIFTRGRRGRRPSMGIPIFAFEGPGFRRL
jgi:hypothetical protein